MQKRSDRAAAAGVPAPAIRADARARHDDDRRRGHNDGSGGHDDGASHRLATTIGPTIPAGAAAAGCACGLSEPDDRACDHGCGKQVFHWMILLVLGAALAAHNESMSATRHVNFWRHVDTAQSKLAIVT